MTYTARREEGIHSKANPFAFNNRWVVRDQDGFFVDCDKYCNDLRERFVDEGLEVIDIKVTNLDGRSVRLANGTVVILDHKLGNKNRPERYESRCGSYVFTMDGVSTCRAKYNIVEAL